MQPENSIVSVLHYIDLLNCDFVHCCLAFMWYISYITHTQGQAFQLGWFREAGRSNFGMWPYYRENSSMYKRTPSRDYSNMEDVEENSGILPSLNLY